MIHLRWLNPQAWLLLEADGVLDPNDMGQLMLAEQGFQQLQLAARETVTHAEAQARQIVEAAQVKAQEILATAQQHGQATAQLGYRKGQREALDTWHAAARQGRRERSHWLQARRDWMAQTIVDVVSEIVAAQPPELFFQEALSRIAERVAEQSHYVLHIHPQDLPAVEAALRRPGSASARLCGARILTNAELAPLTCRLDCETGVLDGSLDVQLSRLARELRHHLETEESQASPQPPGAFP